MVNQRQTVAGTLTSHIVLTDKGKAKGYFKVSSKGCASGKVTFNARRTGAVKT